MRSGGKQYVNLGWTKRCDFEEGKIMRSDSQPAAKRFYLMKKNSGILFLVEGMSSNFSNLTKGLPLSLQVFKQPMNDSWNNCCIWPGNL